MSPFRPAGPADAVALRDLEREANLVALAHIFPPEDHPFPDEEVLARWRRTLAEPGVVVEVVDGPGEGRLACFVAYDAGVLRHLAVSPARWGTGLARAAVARAEAAISTPRLWCLRDNGRARGLYAHLGWRATGRERAAEWPPYPIEVEYARER